VGERDEPAVASCAEPHALMRCRPHAHELEHLLPRHRDLDRLLQRARREDREDHLGVNAELRAESSAHEWRGQMNARRLDSERARDRDTRLADDLRAEVDGHVVAAPRRQAGVRFHRLRELIWCRVSQIDLDRGRFERRVEVADRGIGRQAGIDLLGRVCVFQSRGQVVVGKRGRVVDAHEIRRGACLLERLRDDERDGLAVVANLVAAQHRQRPRIHRRNRRIRRALRRCIAVRHHQAHLWRFFGP
jgi:hypothetical protein